MTDHGLPSISDQSLSFRACVKDVFLVSPPFPQPSPQSLAHGLHKNIAAGINEANSGADYGVSHAAPRCETSALGRPPWPECRPHWLRTVALLGTYPLIFYSAQQTAMACPILPSHFRAFWRTPHMTGFVFLKQLLGLVGVEAVMARRPPPPPSGSCREGKHLSLSPS